MARLADIARPLPRRNRRRPTLLDLSRPPRPAMVFTRRILNHRLLLLERTYICGNADKLATPRISPATKIRDFSFFAETFFRGFLPRKSLTRERERKNMAGVLKSRFIISIKRAPNDLFPTIFLCYFYDLCSDSQVANPVHNHACVRSWSSCFSTADTGAVHRNWVWRGCEWRYCL